MEAIILAGGLGTRLGDLTKFTPKPMLLIRDRPFLGILIEYWIAQGVRRFVLSVGHHHEAIQAYLGTSYDGADIVYSVEEELLGTAGGLLLAAQKLKSNKTFLVLNGDTFFEVPLNDFTPFHIRHSAECSIALFESHTRDRYEGIILDSNEKIKSFASRRDRDLTQYSNGGVYLMSSSALEGFEAKPEKPLSLENDLFPQALKMEKAFFGFKCSGRFIDIGTPEDYRRAQDILR